MKRHRRTTDPSLTVADRVKTVIGNTFGVMDEDITPSKKLQGDFDGDSIDMADLLYNLEEEFGHSIPDVYAYKFRTVGDVLDFITERLVDGKE